MKSDDEIRKQQLNDAKLLDEMGIDPDKIMVTYTPSEYEEMYALREENPYILNEETVDFFPIELLGSAIPLKWYSFGVDAFSNSTIKNNIVILYITALRKALSEADEEEYTSYQLESQINIQNTLALALATALRYYESEYETDEKAYDNAVNNMQKYELAADIRYSVLVIDNINRTIKINNNFIAQLTMMLNDARKESR